MHLYAMFSRHVQRQPGSYQAVCAEVLDEMVDGCSMLGNDACTSVLSFIFSKLQQ